MDVNRKGKSVSLPLFGGNMAITGEVKLSFGIESKNRMKEHGSSSHFSSSISRMTLVNDRKVIYSAGV